MDRRLSEVKAINCEAILSLGYEYYRSSSDRLESNGDRSELKLVCRDPKGGDLCVFRLKSSESLMEDRSLADVQIAGHNHVKGRKTHRTT